VALSSSGDVSKVKQEVIDCLVEHFGKDAVVYPYFMALSDSEVSSVFDHCFSSIPLDRMLHMVHHLMNDTECPIAEMLHNYFWAFFYARGHERTGFTIKYASLGPTAETNDLLSDVLLKVLHGNSSIEFRTVSEFNSLISLRMHWLALDIIKKINLRDEVDIDPGLLPEVGDLFTEVICREERLLLEQAVLSLSEQDQGFLTDCMRFNTASIIAKRHNISVAVVRQRKFRLTQRLSGIVSNKESVVTKLSLQKPALLYLYAFCDQERRSHQQWASRHFKARCVTIEKVNSLACLANPLSLIDGVEVTIKGESSSAANTKLLSKANITHVLIVQVSETPEAESMQQ